MAFLDFFFQLSPSASTITTENIVFTVWRSTYGCSCFWHRIAVTSCHLPVLYSGHPLDVMYFLILLLQRSSQLNLSKQYQPPRNNIWYFVVIQNVAKIQRLQQCGTFNRVKLAYLLKIWSIFCCHEIFLNNTWKTIWTVMKMLYSV